MTRHIITIANYYMILASSLMTEAGVSKESFLISKHRGRSDLEPLRHTRADCIILKLNRHRNKLITFAYGSLRFSDNFRAKCLRAMDISGPIPPDVDMIMGVKVPFSTLIILCSYSRFLIFAMLLYNASGVLDSWLDANG